MSYLALYRKYRSQTFDEIVGQESIVKTLKNALATNKIAHAYLFCGPRGTGKTSIARIFAKALNCKDGLGHICNECSNCISITNGTNPDVIEIDAASNSGVDEVRGLIDKVKYSPINGRYKIYIIDEVHMMSNSAFNALLKTLEEPPSYVVFILCTTEPYKVLPTILSRCQRYDFTKINDEDLSKLICKVLTKEEVDCDEEVIPALVEIANGGARDALSILDQLIAYSGNYIKISHLKNLFGLASNEDKIEFLKLIHENNISSCLNYYDNMLKKSIDINRFSQELLFILKDSLIYLETKSKDLLEYSKVDDVLKLTSFLSKSEISNTIDLLLDFQNELKITNNPNFLFEVYLLKLLNVKESINNNIKENEPTKNIEKKENSTSQIENIKLSKVNNNEVPKLRQDEEKSKDSSPTIKIKDENTTTQISETEEEKIIVSNTQEEISKTPLPKEEKTISEPKVFKESIKKEKKTTSLLKKEGEHYILDPNDLVNLLILNKKDIILEIKNSWEKLEDFIYDSELGEYAALLKDGYPYVANDKFLIIAYDFKNDAKKANIIENHNKLTTILNKISKRKLFLYSIDLSEKTDAYKKYLSLRQINKVPTIDEIGEINIKKGE